MPEIEPTVGLFEDTFDTAAKAAVIEFWIDAADDLLDAALKEASMKNPWTQNTRTRIVLLVARHLLAAEAPDATRETVGDNTFEYSVPSEVLGGLAETRWGRRALVLDTSGVLGSVGKLPTRFWTAKMDERTFVPRHAGQADQGGH